MGIIPENLSSFIKKFQLRIISPNIPKKYKTVIIPANYSWVLTYAYLRDLQPTSKFSMTVDGSEIRRTHQLRLVVYPMIYDGFYHHPQVVGLGSSSINTRWWFPKCFIFTPILGVSCSNWTCAYFSDWWFN